MLATGDRDVCDEPLETRKHRLADLMSGLAGPVIQNTDGIIGEGRALFDVVKARGMEGLVAKRLGGRYAPHRRTGAWIKIKVPGYAPERWADWFARRGQRQEERTDGRRRTARPCRSGRPLSRLGPSSRSSPIA